MTVRHHTPASSTLPWLQRLRCESGSELIETALVLPVFLLIVFGFINFTMILFGLCNLTTGVRVADRYGCSHSNTSMVPATTASITAILNPYLFKYPTNTQAISIVYSSYYGGLNTVGTPLTITATMTYTIQIFGFTYNNLKISAQTNCLVVQ